MPKYRPRETLLLPSSPACLAIPVIFKPRTLGPKSGLLFIHIEREEQCFRKILDLSAFPADDIDMILHIYIIAVILVIKFKLTYQHLTFEHVLRIINC
jgi:hypothetical protein